VDPRSNARQNIADIIARAKRVVQKDDGKRTSWQQRWLLILLETIVKSLKLCSIFLVATSVR
jgi:hypothetical protein